MTSPGIPNHFKFIIEAMIDEKWHMVAGFERETQAQQFVKDHSLKDRPLRAVTPKKAMENWVANA